MFSKFDRCEMQVVLVRKTFVSHSYILNVSRRVIASVWLQGGPWLGVGSMAVSTSIAVVGVVL